MEHARIGFCCTFVSPVGDEEVEAKAKNLASADLASHVRKAVA